jgi:hypothetical protein
MNFTGMNLAELLWMLENYENLDDGTLEEETVKHQYLELIAEIQSQCLFAPFEERPWTYWDFQFNQIFIHFEREE